MSGGGGGASGAVSWPTYLMEIHNDWLNDTGGDFLNQSMTASMNNAMGNDPWIAVEVPLPAAQIDEYKAAVNAFGALLSGINPLSDWNSFYTQAANVIGDPGDLELVVADMEVEDISVADMADVDGITEAVIVADVDAFADQLDDEINTKVLPQFRRGMQDINAVVSSSFVIGEAILWAFRDRDVAKHDSAIRLSAAAENAKIELEVGKANLDKDVSIAGLNLGKNVTVEKANMLKDLDVGSLNMKTDAEYARLYLDGSTHMMQLYIQSIAWEESYAKTMVEANRISIVAWMEYVQYAAIVNEQSALWDLEVFQYGANMLAGPSGGVKTTKGDKPNAVASAIGGGLSGAAAGAATGAQIGGTSTGPYAAIGAAAGAVLGAAAGYFGARM